MKKVFVVQMSDSKKLVFPESCVVCGHRQGERLTTLKVGDEFSRVDFYLYNFRRITPGRPFMDVPAHPKCVKEVLNRFLKRLIVMIIVGISVVMICVMIKIGEFFCSMAALVLLGIFIGFEVSNPLPLEYHHYGQKYVFFFKQKDYAEGFALLNKVNVIEGDYNDYNWPM